MLKYLASVGSLYVVIESLFLHPLLQLLFFCSHSESVTIQPAVHQQQQQQQQHFLGRPSSAGDLTNQAAAAFFHHQHQQQQQQWRSWSASAAPAHHIISNNGDSVVPSGISNSVYIGPAGRSVPDLHQSQYMTMQQQQQQHNVTSNSVDYNGMTLESGDHIVVRNCKINLDIFFFSLIQKILISHESCHAFVRRHSPVHPAAQQDLHVPPVDPAQRGRRGYCRS